MSFRVLSQFEYCQYLSFFSSVAIWVLSKLEFEVLLLFEVLSFVAIWVFKFCHKGNKLLLSLNFFWQIFFLLMLTNKYVFVLRNYLLLHKLKTQRQPNLCQLFTYAGPMYVNTYEAKPNDPSHFYWPITIGEGSFCLQKHSSFVCFKTVFAPSSALPCSHLGFWVLSIFEFGSFVKTWVFKFCPKLSFWVLSKFVVLSFRIIWVLLLIEFLSFCHNLSFWVLSQFEFLSFVAN